MLAEGVATNRGGSQHRRAAASGASPNRFTGPRRSGLRPTDPENTAYKVGTTIRVNTEAKPSPAMMVTDMFTKNTSDSSGIRPSIVVAAASTTGRTRLTQESSRASYGCLPLSICWSISPQSARSRS